jgi:hypothetical protein
MYIRFNANLHSCNISAGIYNAMKAFTIHPLRSAPPNIADDFLRGGVRSSMREVQGKPDAAALIPHPADTPAPLRRANCLIELTRAKLHWLFLIYALPAVIFLSVAMPPFQVTDELNHLLRADQVGQGQMLPSGLGTVEGGLVALGALYQGMWFHPEVKQNPALARQASSIQWSGPQEGVNFQNTAQYGPVLYIPQALGIRLGKWAGLSVVQTLVLARIINGLVACAVGFFALIVCRRARALTFATLLLPMCLSQLASASQDALLISLSLLAVSVASRVLTEQRPAGIGEFVLFALVVMATVLARPSQIALALLAPAFVTRRDPFRAEKPRVALLASIPIAMWFWFLTWLMPPTPSGWSVARQFEHLVAHPFALPTVMANSFISGHQWLWESVIGKLGWVDTPMPRWYIAAATAALACALTAPANRGRGLLPALLAIVTFLGLLTATCFALYLSWTSVGQATINGLQGRYILPVLPLLGWPVPGCGARRERIVALVWFPVLLFPLVTLAVLPGVIMERYYGSWAIMAESLHALLLR